MPNFLFVFFVGDDFFAGVYCFLYATRNPVSSLR